MKKNIKFLLTTIILTAFILAGCEIPPDNVGDTLKKSSQEIASNQKTLEQTQPVPKITYSLERLNQIERNKKLNDPNRIGYLYELGDNGVIIDYFVVKGKVSSTQSYLVPDQTIVDDPYHSGTGSLVVQAPDIDGSYGNNQEGIYFFEPDGTMHEWNGLYHYSEKPLKMTTKPLLISTSK